MFCRLLFQFFFPLCLLSVPFGKHHLKRQWLWICKYASFPRFYACIGLVVKSPIWLQIFIVMWLLSFFSLVWLRFRSHVNLVDDIYSFSVNSWLCYRDYLFFFSFHKHWWTQTAKILKIQFNLWIFFICIVMQIPHL